MIPFSFLLILVSHRCIDLQQPLLLFRCTYFPLIPRPFKACSTDRKGEARLADLTDPRCLLHLSQDYISMMWCRMSIFPRNCLKQFVDLVQQPSTTWRNLPTGYQELSHKGTFSPLACIDLDRHRGNHRSQIQIPALKRPNNKLQEPEPQRNKEQRQNKRDLEKFLIASSAVSLTYMNININNKDKRMASRTTTATRDSPYCACNITQAPRFWQSKGWQKLQAVCKGSGHKGSKREKAWSRQYKDHRAVCGKTMFLLARCLRLLR